MTPIEEALEQGYSQDEINAYLSQKRVEAKDQGYTDEEINRYIKDNITQQPDFNQSPVASQGRKVLSARQAPTNLMEAISTGWDWSSLGLGSEALKKDGHLPSMAVDSDTPWHLRAAANVAGLAGDVPAMIAGGIIGGSTLNPIAAVGGGFGLPMGLRKVFRDALENNELSTKKEFADRVAGTMWETAKGWMTGAATAGVGKAVTGMVSGSNAAVKTIVPTAAELTTLTTVSSALEGHAPEPQAFLDNAVVLGVAKAVLPKWNQAKPLTDVYVKTGITPEQVAQDALRGDGVWQDVLDGRTPGIYKEQVQPEAASQTQTQRAPKMEAPTQATQTVEPPIQPNITLGDSYVSKHVSHQNIRKVAPKDPSVNAMERMTLKDGTEIVINRDGNREIAAYVKSIDYLGEQPKPDPERPWIAETWKQAASTWDKIGTVKREADGSLEHVVVSEKYRRQGIATKLTDLATEHLGVKPFAAKDRSEDGAAFLNALRKRGQGATQPTTEQLKPTSEKPSAGPTQKLNPDQEAQARAFLEQPFADIPQMPNEPSRPTHMNYNRISTTDEAKAALSQLSILYESKIKQQQQSPRTWAKSHEDAGKVLGDLLNASPKEAMAFLEGTQPGPSTTAQLLARKELALGFTEDLMRSRAALFAKGDKATPEELAGFLAQVERVSNVHAAFLGQRADVGRALNALKSTQREAEKAQAIIDAINQYGGEKNVSKLVEMLGEYDNPAQAMKFAREATKATKWEQIVEAWKAGLVSGLRTNEINFLSTAAFTTLRLPTESIAAALGVVRRGDDKVALSEIPARAMGMLAGVRDGLKVAASTLRTGDNITDGKTDTFQPKIPGKAGEIIRLPFRFLSASDMLFKTINERGELYSLATKQALREGLHVGKPSFYSRVAELAANPPKAIREAAQDAALRYTFTKPLGPGGQSFARTVRAWRLEWLFPFVTTPGNIFKETARMTPGLNLAVKEWRDAYEKGGAARDQALAEVVVGGAIMAAVMAAVRDGTLTGNGTPDKRVRATNHAAGWKPYAVKVNGQYVDGYLRMAPIGPLIGIAADSAEFWDYMSDGERDQWARMLAFAFAQNVTNQTFMSGMTNFVNVLQDPMRYGENYFEALAGSLVPGFLSQTAGEMDPLMREVHGMREAMIARIPLQREGLLPKRDLFGEPIKNPDRLWWGSPFSTTAISSDKVRTEAARIGFAAPTVPKKVDVLPGANVSGLDMVELTPEQKDVFATSSGKMAYEILNGMVNQPAWDSQPDIIKRQLYEKAFKKGRDYANMQTLMGLDPTVQQHVVEKFQKELAQ